jgi:hypothetical protein
MNEERLERGRALRLQGCAGSAKAMGAHTRQREREIDR